ncbi:hypothetical protein AB0D46_37820 [Streptomyces sp. NPDC048383]
MTGKTPAEARRGCPHCGATPVPGGGPEGGATIHAKGCPRGGRTGIR